MTRLRGARVLVTGASGGIGAELARGFADRGAELVVTGRREQELAALRDELGATVVVADLSEPSGVDRVVEASGRVDVLVANAALPASGTLDDFSVEQLDRILDVNLRAPVMLAQALMGPMLERRGGHLVFVGSLAGRTASPMSSMYSATKFGLRGFALGLRQDLAGTGVGVSLVQPGFVREAGMFADAGGKAPAPARTVSPAQVVAATLRAVDRNLGEVNVAPVELRVATAVGSVFPGVAEWVQARAVDREEMAGFVEAQKRKR